MAVSLDEAWGDSLGFAPSVVNTEEDDPEPKRYPPPAPRRSSKKTSHALDVPPMDLGSCLEALQNVSRELRDMRTLFARQQHEQKIVLYVATGIVILLLLFTAHSYSRLQYASECMMHWRR